MTTRAQSWYIDANPDKSHNFIDNEDFEQFRDNLLIVMGMSTEKVDEEVASILPAKPKAKVTSGVIYRRSHEAIRSALLREKLSLVNIQRFLLNELNQYSQQMEENTDEELVAEWKSQIDSHLKKFDAKTSFETLLGVFAKVLTLSVKGKTMQTYLKAGKKNEVKEEDIEETDDSSDDTSGFTIPGSR
jgi:hypothetical protein